MAVIKDLEDLSKDLNSARVGFFNEFKFGYLGEVNSKHNTSYPLMVLTPPMSHFKDPYKNDEEFHLKFYLYNPVKVDLDDSGERNLGQDGTVI